MTDDIAKIIREGVKDQVEFFKNQGNKWLNSENLPLSERTQIYSDYLMESIKFNQEYSNALAKYAPKNDFEDFAKCMETRRVNNAINNAQESLQKNIPYLNDETQPADKRNYLLDAVAVNVLASAVMVHPLTVDDALQQHMAAIKKAYNRDDLRMQIQRDCGDFTKLMISYNSPDNNNATLNNEALDRIAASFAK